jgi:hypothetical protein
MSNHRKAAMTLIEAVVVILVVGFFAVMLLPALVPVHRYRSHIDCVNDLKEDYLGFKIWEDDNGGKYPMDVSTNLGGALEFFDKDELGQGFMVVSNQLATPKTLVCPEDNRRWPTNWADLQNINISYFVNLNATESDTNSVLFGDRNVLGGVPLPNGLTAFNHANPIHWDSNMHHDRGNIVYTDGRVDGSFTSERLFQVLGQTTNRYAFP